MSDEIHVFVTNIRGERVSIGVQPNIEGARDTIRSIRDLSKDKRKKLGYSNPRIKVLNFKV